MAGTADLSLRFAQGEVFQSRDRFRVLVAGRRFGKSYLSCIELLRGAIDKPGETFFYCAPTYRMAKDIAWKTLKSLVPPKWVKSKNESDLKIELVNGSMIELKGTENAMALRSQWLRPRRSRLHGLGRLVRSLTPRFSRQTGLGAIYLHPRRNRQLVLRFMVLRWRRRQ